MTLSPDKAVGLIERIEIADNFNKPLTFADPPLGFNPHSGAESGGWDDDDAEEDVDADFDCGVGDDGLCQYAGSEWCDFECPFRDTAALATETARKDQE